MKNKIDKTIWTNKPKDLPNFGSWYWVQYQGKNGVVICPAYIYFWDRKSGGTSIWYSIHTARNDLFYYYIDDVNHPKGMYYGGKKLRAGKIKFANRIETPR